MFKSRCAEGADAVGDGLEERERVALARAEELRVELERPRVVVCRPLDRIPEVHHPLGGGEAVIPDALFTTNATLPRRRRRRGRGQRGRNRCQGRGDAAGVRRSRPGHQGTRTPPPPNRPPTHASTVTRPHTWSGSNNNPSPNPAKRPGASATPSSPASCSSSTAPAQPGWKIVSTPYAQPPEDPNSPHS